MVSESSLQRYSVMLRIGNTRNCFNFISQSTYNIGLLNMLIWMIKMVLKNSYFKVLWSDFSETSIINGLDFVFLYLRCLILIKDLVSNYTWVQIPTCWLHESHALLQFPLHSFTCSHLSLLHTAPPTAFRKYKNYPDSIFPHTCWLLFPFPGDTALTPKLQVCKIGIYLLSFRKHGGDVKATVIW
jgi:hypothetical protein